ncbi:hypothetical protein RhiTH_008971 [Rhizoctonia solani]
MPPGVMPSQAARDASFEAVIEVMWGTLLSEQDGIQLWEDRCKRTEDCVRKASAAAADAALTFPLTPLLHPPVSGDLGSATNWLVKSKTKPATSRIALLAKAAWSKAWKDATLANEIYVPLVSNGVATYVMNHLPEAVIKIDKTAPGAVKRMVATAFQADWLNITTVLSSNLTCHYESLVWSKLMGAHSSNSNSFAIASLNKLSGSSSNARTQEPHKINFTEEGNSWRKGDTEEWYPAADKIVRHV